MRMQQQKLYSEHAKHKNKVDEISIFDTRKKRFHLILNKTESLELWCCVQIFNHGPSSLYHHSDEVDLNIFKIML